MSFCFGVLNPINCCLHFERIDQSLFLESSTETTMFITNDIFCRVNAMINLNVADFIFITSSSFPFIGMFSNKSVYFYSSSHHIIILIPCRYERSVVYSEPEIASIRCVIARRIPTHAQGYSDIKWIF